MSEDSPLPKKKPARAMNRWGLGTLSVLQIVFLAIFLMALNYLAALHFTRMDLSNEAAYTLSPSTRNYLKDAAVKDRSVPMKWIMAFRRSSPFYERARVLLEEYARRSDGKIELEIVDPMRSADRVQEITAAYGIQLVSDLIIMDARLDDSAVSREDESGTKTLNPNVKIVLADELAIYTAAEGQRRITGFQGEDVITARLVESIEGQPRKMLFLADKSRIDADGADSPWQSLEDQLRFQNIDLIPVNLADLKEIPSDAEGVALIAPKYDLTDAELEVLETYWNRPRAAFLVMLKPGEVPAKLRGFLRSNGVTPRRDRILGWDDKRRVTTARGSFTAGLDFTKQLAGQAMAFEGATSSLEVREGAENLMNRQIRATPLIEAAAGFWGETKFGEGNESFDEKEDNAAPLYMAASVTRGAISNDQFAAEVSRMIVISNTDFLDPERHRAETMDFLASSATWLMDRESLAGIGPRQLGTYKLPLLDAQVSFINRVNLFFMPAFLLVIAAFVWTSRRA